jgi:hypothetical protein
LDHVLLLLLEDRSCLRTQAIVDFQRGLQSRSLCIESE